MESMSPTPSIGVPRTPYLALLMQPPTEREQQYETWWLAHARAMTHMRRCTDCVMDRCTDGQALWDEAERLEDELPHRRKVVPGHGPTTASAGEGEGS